MSKREQYNREKVVVKLHQPCTSLCINKSKFFFFFTFFCLYFVLIFFIIFRKGKG